MSAENFSWLDGLLVAISVAIALILPRPAVRDARFWQATPPLASIIGSGFLVVAPLLAGIAGTLSVAAISAIVLLSLWLGSALRFNIRHCDYPAPLRARSMAAAQVLAATIKLIGTSILLSG